MGLRSGIGAIAFVFFLLMILIPVLPDLIDRTEDARTDSEQETGLACSTGVGETSCSVTLAEEHAFEDTTAMTVTETSPSSVDRTTNASLASDGVTVTVGGLSASTSYEFTVDYLVLAPGLSGPADRFLRAFGIWVVIGVFILVGYLVMTGTFRPSFR